MSKAGTLRRSAPGSRNAQSGVGLTEVMIAVLVLALGVLGLAAMQASALRNAQSGLERGNAIIQAYSMLDAMRANPAQAEAGAYNHQPEWLCARPPTTTSLSDRDLDRWVAGMHAMLGARSTTCGQVRCLERVCTVRIKWDDSRGSEGREDTEFRLAGHL